MMHPVPSRIKLISIEESADKPKSWISNVREDLKPWLCICRQPLRHRTLSTRNRGIVSLGLSLRHNRLESLDGDEIAAVAD